MISYPIRGSLEKQKMAARCSQIGRVKYLWNWRNPVITLSSKLCQERGFHSEVTNFQEERPASANNNQNADQGHIPEKKKKMFGYIDGKKDRNLAESMYMNMIKLPPDLKESYLSFCKKYPKKTLTEDGQKLNKHLRNRGRPTERTWRKLKESKVQVKAEVQDFHINEEKEDVIAEKIMNDDDNDESFGEKEENNLILLDAGNGNDGMPIKRERKKKTEVPKKAAYTVIRYGKRETAAFAAGRVPACFGTTKRVLNEIRRRDPDFKPKTLLDFGSGTGTAVWAANDIWGDSLREFQCIDVSEDANNACQFLLRGSNDASKPLKIPGVYFRRFLPLSNKVTYDVVVSAYTLSELPFRKQRQFALSNLWAKVNDYLVIVEHGNNEGFDIALQARNYVTQGSKDAEDVFAGYIEMDQGFSQEELNFILEEPVDAGYVFAPCPHDSSCPRSEIDGRDHPCNFEQKVELAFSQRNTTLKRWGYATERFSYLILRKGERSSDVQSMPRILHPPKRRKGHVICDTCSSNGNIEQHVFTRRKDPEMYKGVRNCLKWGDLMPKLDDKKPKKIITFENKVIKPKTHE